MMRLNKLTPLLDRWYQDLEVYRTKKANSKFEKAVNYAFNQREAVYRIFEDGALELTNNRAERAVKEIVMERKIGYSPSKKKEQWRMQSTNHSS